MYMTRCALRLSCLDQDKLRQCNAEDGTMEETDSGSTHFFQCLIEKVSKEKKFQVRQSNHLIRKKMKPVHSCIYKAINGTSGADDNVTIHSVTSYEQPLIPVVTSSQLAKGAANQV